MVDITQQKKDLLQKINDQLEWDARLLDAKINVDIIGDAVKLTGVVSSYNALQAAESSVYMVPGVKYVDNELKVKYPESVPTPADAELKTNIENQLQWNNSIDASDIKVTVKDGIITLEGSVGSYWKKQVAEDVAYSTYGTQSVDNKLSIVPTKDLDDKKISNDVVSALNRNRNVDAETIDVKVASGVVTLSGIVPDHAIKAEVLKIASHSAGVIDIIDELQYKSS